MILGKTTGLKSLEIEKWDNIRKVKGAAYNTQKYVVLRVKAVAFIFAWHYFY